MKIYVSGLKSRRLQALIQCDDVIVSTGLGQDSTKVDDRGHVNPFGDELMNDWNKKRSRDSCLAEILSLIFRYLIKTFYRYK